MRETVAGRIDRRRRERRIARQALAPGTKQFQASFIDALVSERRHAGLSEHPRADENHRSPRIVRRDAPDFVDSDIDVLYRVSGDSYDKPSDKRTEIQANHFAAGLLMPERWIREWLGRTSDPIELAAIFLVSPEAMRIRLANLPTG